MGYAAVCFTPISFPGFLLWHALPLPFAPAACARSGTRRAPQARAPPPLAPLRAPAVAVPPSPTGASASDPSVFRTPILSVRSVSIQLVVAVTQLVIAS